MALFVFSPGIAIFFNGTPYILRIPNETNSLKQAQDTDSWFIKTKNVWTTKQTIAIFVCLFVFAIIYKFHGYTLL